MCTKRVNGVSVNRACVRPADLDQTVDVGRHLCWTEASCIASMLFLTTTQLSAGLTGRLELSAWQTLPWPWMAVHCSKTVHCKRATSQSALIWSALDHHLCMHAWTHQLEGSQVDVFYSSLMLYTLLLRVLPSMLVTIVDSMLSYESNRLGISKRCCNHGNVSSRWTTGVHQG